MQPEQEVALIKDRLQTVLQKLTAALCDKGYDAKWDINRYPWNVYGSIKVPNSCITIEVAADKNGYSIRSRRHKDRLRVKISRSYSRLKHFPEPKTGFKDNVVEFIDETLQEEKRRNLVLKEQNANYEVSNKWAIELKEKHRLSGYGNVRVNPIKTTNDPKVEITLNVRASQDEADQILKAFRRAARAPGCKLIKERQ